MAYDFEKQIKEMQQGKGIPVPKEAVTPPHGRQSNEEQRSTVQAVEIQQQDPSAVEFALQWYALAGHVLAILGLSGWVVYAAWMGTLDQSMVPVYGGGGAMLFLMAKLPGTLRIDEKGVHQVYFLGLWERSIAKNDIAYYWRTTRRELRRAGLIRNEWRKRRQHGDGFEPVVFVASKSSRRYLIHTSMHQRQSDFARELHDRGIPPRGYEGWESFMAARGVAVS